jgi:hypothetical protein
MRSKVTGWTHILLANTTFSHLHGVCASGVSSSLAVSVTLNWMSRVGESLLHEGGPASDFIFVPCYVNVVELRLYTLEEIWTIVRSFNIKCVCLLKSLRVSAVSYRKAMCFSYLQRVQKRALKLASLLRTYYAQVIVFKFIKKCPITQKTCYDRIIHQWTTRLWQDTFKVLYWLACFWAKCDVSGRNVRLNFLILPWYNKYICMIDWCRNTYNEQFCVYITYITFISVYVLQDIWEIQHFFLFKFSLLLDDSEDEFCVNIFLDTRPLIHFLTCYGKAG